MARSTAAKAVQAAEALDAFLSDPARRPAAASLHGGDQVAVLPEPSVISAGLDRLPPANQQQEAFTVTHVVGLPLSPPHPD